MSVLIDYSSGAFAANKAQGVGTVTAGTGTYNLAVASYDSVSFSVASQEGIPDGIEFNSDGTKVYITGQVSDKVFEYNLSTAWDLSTASYNSVNFSVTSQMSAPVMLRFNPDGTKLYIMDQVSDDVFQYSLSTAFDVSTLSYASKSFSATTQTTNPLGMDLNNNGTKFYIAHSGGEIFQYSLSTAYDISTASYDSVSFNSGAQDSNVRGFRFNPDGTKLFTVGNTNDKVFQYSLSTGFDLSTASYDSVSFSVTQDGSPADIAFKSDGSKMYLIGFDNDTIYQYSTGTDTSLDISSGTYFNYTPTANTTFTFGNAPASGTAAGFALAVTGANAAETYDIANASYDNKDLSPSEDNGIYDMAFKPDGTKLYISGGQNQKVYQYSVSTPFDISTTSYDNKSFVTTSQSSLPTGVAFKSDGTRMFVFDFSNKGVFQYNLSTAWDVSTASYSNTSLTLTTGSSGFDLDFSTDGTKFIVTWRGSGSKVVLYNMSTAWDISTASFGSETGSLSSQITSNFPTSGTLNANGTRLFVADYSTGYIYQYSLSTAFDLSTASYDSVSFRITTAFTNPSKMSLSFSPDGTKMYSIAAPNRITQYTTGSSATATFSYPASVEWPLGTTPDGPAIGETDVLVFLTDDGGTSYQGFQAGDAMS